MRVGLLNVGSDTWIAGVYYVSNLIRALRSLPENEQPEIILISRPGGDGREYGDIEALVELLPYSAPNKLVTVPSRIRHTVKRLLSTSSFALSLARGVKRLVEGDPYAALAETLSGRGISLLFPCMNSMGPNFGIPWLAWVWDFQHRYYPEFFSKDECQSRDRTLGALATEARLIVTSSRSALADFERFLPGYRQKLRVLHFRTVPTSVWYATDVTQTRRKFNLPTRYLILPNQFWVHKNHGVVFEAIRILVEGGVDAHLVCTGSTTDYRQPEYFQRLCEYIWNRNLQNRIRIFGLISRHEQIQVLRGAMAIVQPSLFEGWSTVVEEARALGKRLFLSDIPVHREQNPPSAVYFNPSSPEALAEEVAKVWETLSPGPSSVDEQAALAAQQSRVIEYARTFLHIARELLQAGD